MKFFEKFKAYMKQVFSLRYQHDEEVMEPPNPEAATLKFLTFVREPGDMFGPRPAYRHHSGPCRPSTKEDTLVPFGHCSICGKIMQIPHSQKQLKLQGVITVDECRQQGPNRVYRDHSGPCSGAASSGTTVPNGHCATCGQHMPRSHSCQEHRKKDTGGNNDDVVSRCGICGRYLKSL